MTNDIDTFLAERVERVEREVNAPPLHPTIPPPRRFVLNRLVDATGISGTGVVAYGVVWGDGRCTIRWASEGPCQTALWDSLDDVVAIHGHAGNTEVLWID